MAIFLLNYMVSKSWGNWCNSCLCVLLVITVIHRYLNIFLIRFTNVVFYLINLLANIYHLLSHNSGCLTVEELGFHLLFVLL